MNRSEPGPAEPSSTLATLLALAAALGLGYLALSQRLPAPLPQGLGATPRFAPCVMDRDGYWQGRLFGAGALTVDWRGAELECAGNARPNGRGLRLFFAGRPDAEGERLLLVLGMAADIATLAGRELPADVTLVDEATSEFFHGGGDRCFARIGEVQPLPGKADAWRVDGELYCTGAIAAVGGELSVTLADVRFSGRLELGPE